jgi:hypothetical protein
MKIASNNTKSMAKSNSIKKGSDYAATSVTAHAPPSPPVSHRPPHAPFFLIFPSSGSYDSSDLVRGSGGTTSSSTATPDLLYVPTDNPEL